ncbi:MAG: hypothetical protein J7K78_04630 [Thaumarchaeota archaeon]|nr:hypothetical protein [Nitrososphaerota archaeon]
MELTLYTPGHGIFMDSLIMYGMTSPIPHEEYEIYGSRDFFEIKIRDMNLESYAEKLRSSIFSKREHILQLLVDRLKLVQKKSRSKLQECMDQCMNLDFLINGLREYLRPGHAEREGRDCKVKRAQTAWLPLYPHLGKYLTSEFKYSQKEYRVCPTCIVLASLGLVEGSMIVRGLRLRMNAILITFEGKVSGRTLNRVLTYLREDEVVRAIGSERRFRQAADILPLNTFLGLIFTCFAGDVLAELYYSDASFLAESLTFEISRGVVQIRGYEEIPVDGYLSSLVNLVEKGGGAELSKLRDVLKMLLDRGEASAIDAIYQFLTTRRPEDLYRASRLIAKALERGFGKDLCRSLASIIT